MLLDETTNILGYLAEHARYHARDTMFYGFLDRVMKYAFREAAPRFEGGKPVRVGELGELILPYEQMGAIDSIDLFGVDELILFAFYYRNRDKYRKAADIGGNIGLHSIVMSKCGIETQIYEPDPMHFEKLTRNLKLNNASNSRPFKAAVSDRNGRTEFVRVLGNTTSSHLAGAKTNPYGELERFEVEVLDIKEISSQVDLLKVDAEGHEVVILNAIPAAHWSRLDAFVEIGTPENAEALWQHFHGISVNIFSQKRGWEKANSLDDLPKSYKEGGIFLSSKSRMPW